MTGENSVRLNQATMVAVVQHYFDTMLFARGEAPLVGRVEIVDTDYPAGTFEVHTLDRPEPVPE
jgi:hypothetical protein